MRLPLIQRVIFPLLALSVILVLPVFASGYWVRVITSAMMFAVMAQATDLISGWAGYPALGNVVFWGTGAYVTGVLMSKAHLPVFVAVVVGGLVAATYAVLLGIPIFKTRGHYFVMATLGVNEATKEIVLVWGGLTGGGRGLMLPVVSDLTPAQLYGYIYYAMAAVLVLTIATTFWVSRGALGYGLRAIRDDKEGAGALGINQVQCKITAWALGAFFIGIVGGIYAYWIGFIEAGVVFDVLIGVKFFVMLLLGGAGTLWGPVVGAFGLEILGDLIWAQFPEFNTMVMGLMIILVVVAFPKGVMEFFSHRFSLNAVGKFIGRKFGG